MKNFRILVLIILVAIAAPFLLHRRAWALKHDAAESVQPSALRIISPRANETIAQTFVEVQYRQLASASAANAPKYELRLDERDPVRTTDTSYTFNGVSPGAHELMVRVVDANGVPVSGNTSEVKFSVVAPMTGAGPSNPGAASNLPPLPTSFNSDLPAGNSSLPLLSIIGFGILVGGVISALRTRPAHK